MTEKRYREWEGRERRRNLPSGWDQMRSEITNTTPPADDHALDSSAPWMARLFYAVLSKEGLTGLILLAVLAMWTGWLSSPITETRTLVVELRDDIADIRTLLANSVARMEGEVSKSHQSNDHMVQAWRMVCLRLSKTRAENEECWGWKP